MVFYTVDRIGSLARGTTLGLVRYSDVEPRSLQEHIDTLFPAGVTDHGERYFLKGTTPAKNDSARLELVSEYVRRCHFPERPSRLQSVFGWSTVDEAEEFRRKFSSGLGSIWKVECQQGFRANMTLLALGGPLLVLSWRAHAYWQGLGGLAMPEVWENLLVPPVRVIEEVNELKA